MDDSRRSLLNFVPPNSGPTSNPDRDALLIKLLFASSRLANALIEIIPVRAAATSANHCMLCDAYNKHNGERAAEHSKYCAAGNVLEILNQILALPVAEPAGLPSSEDLDRVAEEQQAAAATSQPNTFDDAEEQFVARQAAQAAQPDEYGEPWITDPADAGALRNQHDFEVHSGCGTELPQEDEARYAERIKACVNACAGLSTEVLDRTGMEGATLHAFIHLTPSDFNATDRPAFIKLLERKLREFKPQASALHGVDALSGKAAPAVTPFVYQEVSK